MGNIQNSQGNKKNQRIAPVSGEGEVKEIQEIHGGL